ncbi:MAG: hypothetical protein ICV72_03460, partial [Aldersonia sp.]|nr:hypothetical protein [Aldersonia sp.]
MSIPLPDDAALTRAIASWLPAQRWFSAKNRVIHTVRIVQRADLIQENNFVAEHVMVDVAFRGATDLRYQIPLGYRVRPVESFADHALPLNGDVVAYDGLRDEVILARYLGALA